MNKIDTLSCTARGSKSCRVLSMKRRCQLGQRTEFSGRPSICVTTAMTLLPQDWTDIWSRMTNFSPLGTTQFPRSSVLHDPTSFSLQQESRCDTAIVTESQALSLVRSSQGVIPRLVPHRSQSSSTDLRPQLRHMLLWHHHVPPQTLQEAMEKGVHYTSKSFCHYVKIHLQQN